MGFLTFESTYSYTNKLGNCFFVWILIFFNILNSPSYFSFCSFLQLYTIFFKSILLNTYLMVSIK